MSVRPAQIVTYALEVHCPYCGEPQPNPDDGSDTWTAWEVVENAGRKQCVSCDEEFTIHDRTTAQVRRCPLPP